MRQAKAEHEKDLACPHFAQCQSVPTTIDKSIHGVHMNPLQGIYTHTGWCKFQRSKGADKVVTWFINVFFDGFSWVVSERMLFMQKVSCSL